MPVEWRRLRDIALPGAMSYLCSRCLEQTPFDDCWSVVPLSVDGKQMLPGYIHCGKCRKTHPLRAWMRAHDKDPH